MQKYSLINIIIIATTIIAMPIMSMESSLITTDVPSFIVTLNLHEAKQEYIDYSWNKSLDKKDEHVYTVLGIPWEENNNKY